MFLPYIIILGQAAIQGHNKLLDHTLHTIIDVEGPLIFSTIAKSIRLARYIRQ